MKMIVNSKIKQQVLMSPPDYFGVFDKYNAHMKRTLEMGRKVRPNVACQQWTALRDIYVQAGYEVLYIDSVPGLPDMVFTANAGLVYKETIVLSKFSIEKRQPETPYIKKWFDEYKIVEIPYFFEGAGDALLWKDILVGGYGFRSEDIGVMCAAEYIEKELVLLKLINEDFYHNDTCFCPMGERALFYPKALDAASIRDLEKAGELIEVSDRDAYFFACNGVYLETKPVPKFIVNDISNKLRKKLENLGIEIAINRTTEFMLSGGSNRCLSLFL